MRYTDIEISEDIVMRVMKENLWRRDFTLRVVEEYKKFLYLASITSVAPSFEIDQVWHAHILFSRDYEKTEELLGKRVHHQPNPAGKSGKNEYINSLHLYLDTFGYNPPKDIWTRRSKFNHAYIDLDSHWVIPEGDWKSLVKVFFKHFKNKIYGLI